MEKEKSDQTEGCCSGFNMKEMMETMQEKAKSEEIDSCCSGFNSSEKESMMKNMMEMMSTCMNRSEEKKETVK